VTGAALVPCLDTTGCHQGNGDVVVPGEEKRLRTQPAGPAACPHTTGKKRSRVVVVPWIPGPGISIPARSRLHLPFPVSSSPGVEGKTGKKICACLSPAGCQRGSSAKTEQRGEGNRASSISPAPSPTLLPAPLPAPCTAAQPAPHAAGTAGWLPGAPPSPPARIPCNKIISTSPWRIWPFLCIGQDQAGSGRAGALGRCGHAGVPPAHGKAMFSLSSPGGLDTLLFSHSF